MFRLNPKIDVVHVPVFVIVCDPFQSLKHFRCGGDQAGIGFHDRPFVRLIIVAIDSGDFIAKAISPKVRDNGVVNRTNDPRPRCVPRAHDSTNQPASAAMPAKTATRVATKAASPHPPSILAV